MSRRDYCVAASSAALLRAAAVLVVLSSVATSSASVGEKQPNVLMVVVDTLRADRLGMYGNRRHLTPFIDELAKRGVVFRNAYSVSSWTVPSVASLLTSRYPSQHHVVTFGSRLGEEEVTFAERLRAAGYAAGGVSANLALVKRWGYAQGFQYWWTDEAPRGAERLKGTNGSDLRSRGLAWLDRRPHRSASEPVLLYFQYIEPHWPYEAPEPFRSRFAGSDEGPVTDSVAELLRLGALTPDRRRPTADDCVRLARLYDAEVAAVDWEMRILFATLQGRGFLDDAVVVLTADHGEEFGEHGNELHGHTLYDESVRVPLIFVGRGIPTGRRVEDNVSLIDVAPTLLDLLGLPAEPRFEGRSLRPLMLTSAAEWGGAHAVGASAAPTDVLFELPRMRKRFDVRVHERGILRGSIKVVLRPDGTHEAHDLASDAGETHPAPPEITQRVRGLMSALEHRRAQLRKRSAAPAQVKNIDRATKARLRALGYTF